MGYVLLLHRFTGLVTSTQYVLGRLDGLRPPDPDGEDVHPTTEKPARSGR